jgi:aminomethyltransferase
VAFLQNLLTNDITRLSAGTGCEAALLTANAKLTATLMVLADPECLWLLCDAERAAVVTQTLERYVFSERVHLTNHERRSAVLALQGPRTLEWLGGVVGQELSLSKPGDHVSCVIRGIAVRLVRHSLTGDVGVLCVCPAERALDLWEQLPVGGRPFGPTLVGWEALNTARIEAGIPWFGIDMDESNLLPETGLETIAVSETKGCYLGQEIVARMQTYGSANKKLMGLLIEDSRMAGPGSRMLRGREEVGSVTSACYSPTLQRPIARGYLKRGSYDPGTRVEILAGDARLRAVVAARPLVSKARDIRQRPVADVPYDQSCQ